MARASPPPRPRRLVLVGSATVDVLMHVDQLPVRGGEVLARSAYAEVGMGRAVLAAARRHGLPGAFAGRYGAGPFGTQVRAALVEDGVDLLIPLPASGDSGFRVGFVESGGARAFATSPGVEAALDADTLRRVPIRDDDAVYLSGYDLAYPQSGPAIAGWLRSLPAGVLLAFDPGPLGGDIPWELHRRALRRSDIVTMSSRQLEFLIGTSRPKAGLRALREYAPGLVAAVSRRGADGCWVYGAGADAVVEVPTPPVDAVDTTGAGEAHTGVLLAGLAAGLPLTDAARRATAAASVSTTQPGAMTCPDADGLDRFLERTEWVH